MRRTKSSWSHQLSSPGRTTILLILSLGILVLAAESAHGMPETSLDFGRLVPVSSSVTPTPFGWLDASLPPHVDTLGLNGGFLPDPYRVQIPSARSSVAWFNVTTNELLPCYGYTTHEPSVKVRWSYGEHLTSILRFYSDEPDSGLVILAPDGNWYCDQSQPSITFNKPNEGTYSVWFSTSTERTRVHTLYLSEGSERILPSLSLSSLGRRFFSNDFPALNGTVSLSEDFQPDPYRTRVWTVGVLAQEQLFELSEQDPFSGQVCSGFVTAAPTITLRWQPQTRLPKPVTLYVYVNPGTLIVSSPNGQWHCDSPIHTTAPLVAIEMRDPGDYRIWVGSHLPLQRIEAWLCVSPRDLGDNPFDYRGAECG